MTLKPKQSSQNEQEITDNIIMEGLVEKYKPGFSKFYKQKYMILTTDYLKIFKSRWQAKMPAFEKQVEIKIPLSQVKICQRVKVKLRKCYRQN